jgi:hypothetical protein
LARERRRRRARISRYAGRRNLAQLLEEEPGALGAKTLGGRLSLPSRVPTGFRAAAPHTSSFPPAARSFRSKPRRTPTFQFVRGWMTGVGESGECRLLMSDCGSQEALRAHIPRQPRFRLREIDGARRVDRSLLQFVCAWTADADEGRGRWKQGRDQWWSWPAPW